MFYIESQNWKMNGSFILHFSRECRSLEQGRIFDHFRRKKHILKATPDDWIINWMTASDKDSVFLFGCLIRRIIAHMLCTDVQTVTSFFLFSLVCTITQSKNAIDDYKHLSSALTEDLISFIDDYRMLSVVVLEQHRNNIVTKMWLVASIQ